MMISRLTLAAAAGMLVGISASANAADLGNSCCADLEERVAELEATTARKGNRVVSLQVFGQVGRGILLFDGEGTVVDDQDNETLVKDSDTKLISDDGSNFGFRGTATIKPGWTAGYQIKLDISGEQGSAPAVEQNNVWIESEQLGRVTLGQASVATDGIAHIVLANTFSDSGAFQNDLYGEFGGSYGDFDGDRGDIIRYDSKSIAGFILSASWSDNLEDTGNGDDTTEFWDVTLRYSAEYKAFRVAAGIGYSEEDIGADEKKTLQGSTSIMHIPSGLFASFSAGEQDDGTVDDDTYWYVNAGVEKKWLPYGKTTFYGEIGEYEDDIDDAMFGFGFTQSFDAAALDLYAQYRNVEEDNGDSSLETVVLGAVIKF